MLKDKVAFITGSTRGIGWATAMLFAQHGASVILNARHDQPNLEAKAEQLRSLHGQPVMTLFGDASDPEVVSEFYQRIFKQFKRLDILINNAGIMPDQLLGMITPDVLSETLDANIKSAVYNTQSAARLMARHQQGSIVMLSSITGIRGSAGQAVYSASKAALIGLAHSAAKELAPQRIRVNVVAPGMIETELLSSLPPIKRDEALEKIALGRIGQPEEVANALLFFASDLSAYVTGQVLGVDGGMVM